MYLYNARSDRHFMAGTTTRLIQQCSMPAFKSLFGQQILCGSQPVHIFQLVWLWLCIGHEWHVGHQHRIQGPQLLCWGAKAPWYVPYAVTGALVSSSRYGMLRLYRALPQHDTASCTVSMSWMPHGHQLRIPEKKPCNGSPRCISSMLFTVGFSKLHFL